MNVVVLLVIYFSKPALSCKVSDITSARYLELVFAGSHKCLFK